MSFIKDATPPAHLEAFQGTAMEPQSKAYTLTEKLANPAETSSDQAVAPHSTAGILKGEPAKTAYHPSALAMTQPGTAGSSMGKPAEKANKSDGQAIFKQVATANVKKASGRGKQKDETNKSRQQKQRTRMSRKEAAMKRDWLLNHRETLYQHMMEQGEKFNYDMTKTPRATAEETELFEEYLAMNPDAGDDDGW